MKITEAVYQVDGVKGANCYLVTGPEVALIDTGVPGQAQRILNFMKELGLDPKRLRWIFLTHHDVDHIGSAASLKELTGALVFMHPAEADCISGRRPCRPFWKSWSCGFARATGWLKVPHIDGLVEDGHEIGPFRVIHTPGHTMGSISILFRNVVFVGDLMNVDNPIRYLANQDTRLCRASLEKILTFDFEILCRGHGKPLPKEKVMERLKPAWAC